MRGGNKLKVTMVFPLKDNDGQPFKDEVMSWFLEEINRIFVDGITALLSPVTGRWHETNDLNRCIWAIVDGDKLREILEFLKTAKERFRQEKMYYEYHLTNYEEVG